MYERTFQLPMEKYHTKICVRNAEQWGDLQKFFEQIIKEKNPDNTHQCSQHALEYVACWRKLGYTFGKLKQLALQGVKQQVKKNENVFQKDQWFRLNRIRSAFPVHISLSFLVDNTVKYFKSESSSRITLPVRVTAKQEKNSVREILSDMEKTLQKHSDLIDIGLALNRHNSCKETAQQLAKLDEILHEKPAYR